MVIYHSPKEFFTLFSPFIIFFQAGKDKKNVSHAAKPTKADKNYGEKSQLEEKKQDEQGKQAEGGILCERSADLKRSI